MNENETDTATAEDNKVTFDDTNMFEDISKAAIQARAIFAYVNVSPLTVLLPDEVKEAADNVSAVLDTLVGVMANYNISYSVKTDEEYLDMAERAAAVAHAVAEEAQGRALESDAALFGEDEGSLPGDISVAETQA